MAHKKGVGSTDNGRDSNAKRLGIKLFGGQLARAGNIIVRQRRTRFHAGENTYLGRDHTLHAGIDGRVAFNKRRKNRTFVSIIPLGDGEALVPAKPVKEKKEKKAPIAPIVSEAKPVVEAKAPSAPAEQAAPVAPPPATKKAASGDKISFDGKKYLPDDHKIVEGVGPKISELLVAGGIKTWAELASTDVSKIKEILVAAGSRYKMHDPSTWPKQAGLAAEGKWDELKEYQDYLDGGVDPAATKNSSEEE